MLSAPLFSLAVACFVVLPLLLGEEYDLAIIYEFLLVGMALVLVASFTWQAFRQGQFVVAANKQGLYYRSLDDKGKLVFLPWQKILKVSDSYGENGPMVVVDILQRDLTTLPRPCHGEIRTLPGYWQLQLEPGSRRNVRQVSESLSGFMRRCQEF